MHNCISKIPHDSKNNERRKNKVKKVSEAFLRSVIFISMVLLHVVVYKTKEHEKQTKKNDHNT
mgnify:CR=1 FL=1